MFYCFLLSYWLHIQNPMTLRKLIIKYQSTLIVFSLFLILFKRMMISPKPKKKRLLIEMEIPIVIANKRLFPMEKRKAATTPTTKRIQPIARKISPIALWGLVDKIASFFCNKFIFWYSASVMVGRSYLKQRPVQTPSSNS